MKRRLYLYGLCLIMMGSACQKRAQCPAYWDSDPRVIFGEMSVQDMLKREKNPTKGLKKPRTSKKKKRR